MAKIVLTGTGGRVAESPDEVMEHDAKLKAAPAKGKHLRAVDARMATHWSVTDLGREVVEVVSAQGASIKPEADNG